MTAKEWIDKRLSFLTGYMTVAAAHQLYGLLVSEKTPINGVEIGVAGGRSLITAALAARDGPGGKVVGIDAYDVDVASEFEQNSETIDWWRTKSTVARERLQPPREINHILHLQAHCELLIAKSQDVAERFSNLTYLHVDGNHCRQAVKRDLDNYLGRVASGGIIRLDNVGWEGVEAEADRVRDVCNFVDGEADHEIWRKR